MSEKFYLIEKPQPGGTYWFTGYRGYKFGSDSWPEEFSESIHEAIQFRTEDDAKAVLRHLPETWREILTVTETPLDGSE